MSDGSRHILYIVEETSSGVTPTNPTIRELRHTNCTLGMSRDDLADEEINPSAQIIDFVGGSDQIAGDISFQLSYGEYDDLFAAAIRSTGWVADTPSAGTDQLKAGTERKSFTVIRYFSDLASGDNPYHIYRGVEISTMELSLTANSRVTGSFGLIGRSFETAADLTALGTVTVTPTTTNRGMRSFNGAFEEGGVTSGVATEVTISLDNGMESINVVGSRNAAKIATGKINVNGNLSALFENSTLLNKFINETSSSLKITMPDPDGNTLSISLPKINYSSGNTDTSGNAELPLSMSYQAVYDTTTVSNIIFERS